MLSKGARSFITAGDFNLQMSPDQYHFGPGSWGSLVADQHVLLKRAALLPLTQQFDLARPFTFHPDLPQDQLFARVSWGPSYPVRTQIDFILRSAVVQARSFVWNENFFRRTDHFP
eukprot:6841479-Alexandrium_andersonii.AAC.1